MAFVLVAACLTAYEVSINYNTVKPVLSGHSKNGNTNVLKTDGSLMQVESIAECSRGAFCNSFDLHLAKIGFEFSFNWMLKTGFTVPYSTK